MTDQTQDTWHEGAEPARPPVPDLGFFAGAPTPSGGSPLFGSSPPSAAPSQFGAPVASQFGTPVASQFGTPVASQFGTPVASQFGTPQPPQHLPPPPPPYGGWPGTMPRGPGYPQAGRSGLPGWAIAVIAGGVGVLVMLILAAVVVPVFLHQRGLAELNATSVSLPPAVAGMTQVDDPAIRRQLADAAASIDTCGCTEPLLMTLYQDDAGTHRVFVAAAKFTRVPSPSQQQSFSLGTWRGIRDGAAGQATVGPAVDVDAGRLGGTMTCAPITAGTTTGRTCVSVDRTSFVMMMVFGAATDAALPVSVREAVVHRT